jgi:hypothetical protein
MLKNKQQQRKALSAATEQTESQGRGAKLLRHIAMRNESDNATRC